MQKTKIIATIGKSSNSRENLKELIERGMNGARINFYHHSYEEIKNIAEIIRDLDNELNTLTSLIGLIRDNKIRTKDFENESCEVNTGDTFTFLCGSDTLGNSSHCSISSDYLQDEIKVNDIIFIDNGAIQFKVLEVIRREIKCTTLIGGTLFKNMQLTIPNCPVSSPLINDEIEMDIELACNLGFDFICCSSINTREDAELYKDLTFKHGKNILKLLSVIENNSSVTNIDDIIDISDGIIISRGALSINTPPLSIPFIQKDIIKKCNLSNKICIVSTEVLSSMSDFPRPTRAEVSDVYNSVLDGVDAVILTNTTSSGSYVADTCTTLKKILVNSEKHLNFEEYKKLFSNDLILDYDSLMASSVADISNKFPAKAIIVGTNNGKLPRNISKYRPKAPIIAVTNNKAVGRTLSIQFGIIPFIYKDFEDKDKFMDEARSIALNYGFAKKLDTIIVLTASKSISWKSDNLKIVSI